VVSQEQFDQVQAKLALNRQFARRHTAAHPDRLRALVSGGQYRLACLGRSLHPRYAYYICRGKAHAIHTGRAEKCPARFIPAQQGATRRGRHRRHSSRRHIPIPH
jgi:site-specific DNA recombinase